MDWYKDFRLVENKGEYTVIINLNPEFTEFSGELGSDFKEKVLNLDDQIRNFVKDKFSDIKVTTVKLLLGSMVVASVPFASNAVTAKAAELNPTSTQQSAVTKGTVTASKLNVRTGPGTNYDSFHTLWQGNVITVIGESNGWYKIQLSNGKTGWVSSTYLKLGSSVTTPKASEPTKPSAPTVDSRQEKINTVISTAKSLVGTPYVWGGESFEEGGFDCSGLTFYVFQKIGVKLNRVSSDQAKQGTTVSKSNLQPGDLVFYSFQGTSSINHVGIYIGNNKMVHSPKPGDTVKITDISTSYWQNRFVTAKRVI
ncbi:MAG TPA: hypothetical protein DGK91_03005 [Clostridium sp.]|nr:hypothetical protein [Clostridium sp.]